MQIATASANMGAMTIEEKAAILSAMDPRDAAAIMGETRMLFETQAAGNAEWTW